MIFIFFFFNFSEAAFIEVNPRIKNQNISSKSCKYDLKSLITNEKLTSLQSNCRLSLQENPSSHSLRGKYTPSAPIRIPYSKEALENLKLDLSKRNKEMDLYQNIDDNSSASSDSLDCSSVGGPSFFEMSYDPIHEEMRKIWHEERKNRRRLEKELKKKNMMNDKNDMTKSESESPNQILFYTEEEDNELKDIIKERTYRCRNIPDTETNFSDIDNDSDFGCDQKTNNCYSLSF
jgi:hypothetical protein